MAKKQKYSEDKVPGEDLLLIPRNLIERNPRNPRRSFNAKRLAELAQSIQKEGQITAVDVRRLKVPSETGARYQLIEGERRWRATALISPTFKLRSVVKTIANEDEQYVISGLANLGREGYTHMDAAHLLQEIQQIRKCTQAELSVMAAKNTAWVSNHLSLLRLHPEIQGRLDPDRPKKDRIPFSLAVVVAAAPVGKQKALVSQYLRSNLSISRAKEMVKASVSRMTGPGVNRRSVGAGGDRPFRTVNFAIDRMVQDAALLLGWDQKHYDSVLRNRSVPEVRTMVRKLEKVQREINTINDRLRKNLGSLA